MKLSGVDLNLLVAFECVYRNKNISKAAKELGLSQPSVSMAIKRFSSIIGDDLFVRLPRGVKPTSRADSLYEDIKSALLTIEKKLNQSKAFNIETYEKEYHVGFVDAFIYLIFPELLKIIEAKAPGIRLIATHYSQSDFSKKLRSGELDFVMGTYGYLDNVESFYSKEVFKDKYCVISKKSHPRIKNNLSLKKYLREEHIITSFEAKMHGFFDDVLKKKGLKRRVKVSVANFLTVPFLIESSECLAGVSHKTALKMKHHASIDIHEVPFETPTLINHLYWSESFEKDPAKDWFLNTINELVG